MLKKSFTLVELLIVIAILGILGVGLLIALDPIEQTRRGQDTTVQQSAIEIKGAINRYFASKLYYPWCDPASPAGACTYLGTDGCTADDIPSNFSSGCANYVMTQLTTTGELKSAPPSNIVNALNLITTSGGLAFVIDFQPASKAFDSSLTYLYSDNLCTTPGNTTTCPASGNDCYYCLR
ncbi:hypothetical protein A2774_01265 [Candidatus Roizmanbacteria bacterium RIFCSPHIGHO2_01_FULL_39_12c]|uniref:Type II secretion system protein GspG C-terminal domain-containing protein n=1 Tax=Candidatus Roizmanbacteria bacterium RIFCSPHIGHO2_01_FULL_39_12c TaxID=1802031 RepID=A0A1F7GDT1_9BACT|nr:MAG: hypothetical protein A2774_01265 [Candidatus Roizmanbacteria bacterium RIFCSPHIGHO2_01_FULL_39_12c]OGK47503.1 MAG: hypothetical protein A2963_01270 [Candidatus Roizmanbacteria bacterium RIFCSPLOWO2_01_FULL_40_13]